MVLGDGGFGRILGHEAGTLMDGISALIQGPPADSLTLTLALKVCTEKLVVYDTEEDVTSTWLCRQPDLRHAALGTVTKNL